MIVTAVLTMMINFRSLGTDAPTLVQAFEIRDVDWARLVMATLGISALSLAIVELAPPLHRLVRALAADGLFCISLARDYALTGTPVAAIAVCGFVASLLASLSPLAPLLQVAACGALLVNAASAAAATLLRFQPNNDLTSVPTQGNTMRLTVRVLRSRLRAIPAAVRRAGEACHWGGERGEPEERAPLVMQPDGDAAEHRPDNSSSDLSGYETDSSNSDTDIDAVVAEFKEKIKVATLGDYAPESVAPDAVTSRRATITLVAAFVTSIVACAALLDMLDHEGMRPAPLLVLSCASVATVALLCIAARQPQAQRKGDECRVPLAPWLPAVTTVFHVMLLMQLMVDAWLVALLFALPGKCNCIRGSRVASREASWNRNAPSW
ncbi:hypothetical protein B566_EDAN006367 [Ephemera danica]|nr:hypothetical protein B566_EDAN006367 [Ephemera danica]